MLRLAAGCRVDLALVVVWLTEVVCSLGLVGQPVPNASAARRVE